MSGRATVVRPHEESMQLRLLQLVRQAGLEADTTDVVARERSEDEVVAELRQKPARLLVIPFRQPGRAETRVTGIELLQRIERELPETARLPVLLPVTVFSAGRVKLTLGESNPDETLSQTTRHRILMVLEDELEEPRTVELLTMHLRIHGG